MADALHFPVPGIVIIKSSDTIQFMGKKSPASWLDNHFKTLGKTENTLCEICGKSALEYQIQAHHIIGRSHRATRWDMANRLWVCARCHTLDEKECVQNNLGGWFLNWEHETDWMGLNRRKDKEYLRRMHYKTKKWTISELEEIKTAYQKAEKDPVVIQQLKYLVDKFE